ncbi:MAG: ATP-binding cassette domain-containing protein [Clostridia bacterium]|jgi:oligopeptide/dipeptide ABC transporter ATP-binding protein|nr:ATP-binding cassette domain-containing protein [Clostridia bacterium]MDH7573965.1 ATP-binding cassette domain-containing protein [Clostridia bacterium]
MLLKVEDLKKVFATGVFKRKLIDAVDGVSFALARGETLGLVGESGCGKSTLGRAVLGLIPPSGGRILFHELEITRASRADLKWLRRKMQIMFQHPEAALDPRMRIYDSLVEPLRIHRVVGSRAEEQRLAAELIDLVGLHPEHLNRYPHELSGGQIQRVVLARILSLEPEFIVADEPTSMLDASVQAQVLRLFKEVQRRFNIACLFISHDLEVVAWISDRVAAMYRGSIVELGPVEKVCKDPKHPYTSLLVGAFFGAGHRGLGSGKVPDLAEEVGHTSGCKFYAACPSAGKACRVAPGLREVQKGHFVACWEV